jgi:hypothetical protein
MTAPQLTTYANGPIAIGGDQLNTFMQTCDTAAQMRGLIGTTGISLAARGINSANDGLGGDFYWNSTATGPDDNLNTIVPTGAGSGAWVRIVNALFAQNQASGQALYREIFPGVVSSDNVVGYNTITAGSSLNQATGVAGYIKDTNPVSGGNGNGVALFGCGTAEVNNAAVWGINTLLQDSNTRAAGTGTGRILVNEFDFNVMNPNTQVIGCSVGGNGLAQPASSNGFIVNSLGSGIKWGGGFVTEDGAAVVAMSIGASSPTAGPNFASQTIDVSFYDLNSTKQVATLVVSSLNSASEGVLTLNGSAPIAFDIVNGNLNLVSGTGAITIGGNQVVGARITGMGAVTGGSNLAFNAATATLQQTAGAAAYALQVLINHGLLGP